MLTKPGREMTRVLKSMRRPLSLRTSLKIRARRKMRRTLAPPPAFAANPMIEVATQKVKPVPSLLEVPQDAQPDELDHRLGDEHRGAEVRHNLQRVRPGVCLLIVLARHRDRVHRDDSHDEPLEALIVREAVRGSPHRVRREVAHPFPLLSEEVPPSQRPQLLLFRHRRGAAVSGLLRDLREVVEDDADEEVEDEKVGHNLEDDKEERHGRVVIANGASSGDRESTPLYMTAVQPSVVLISNSVSMALKMLSKFMSSLFQFRSRNSTSWYVPRDAAFEVIVASPSHD